MAKKNGNSENRELPLADAVSFVGSWASQQRLIRRVYFFGSRVRGDHKPDSDLDIAVELIYPDADTAFAHWSFEFDAWASTLSTGLPWKLDLQFLAAEGTPTISDGIRRSSVLIYDREFQAQGLGNAAQ